MRGDKIVGIFQTKNGREVVVKIAEPEDVEGILKIIRERRKERAIREKEPIQELTNAEKVWWANIANLNPGILVLTVNLGREVVGQVTICRHKDHYDTVLVYSLDVLPRCRSNGLARILMTCAILEAKDSLGAKQIELWATVQNIHAVNLYKSLAFQQKGEILRQVPDKKWNRQPADRINMIRQL